MHELTPTAEHFLLEETPHLVQMLLLGTLCGWIAHRILCLSVNIRGLKVFFGLAGLHAGAWLWQSFCLQPGPTVGNISLPASLVGTLALFGFLKLAEVAIAAAESP
jgi:uncharacterized membrane protein YeaQ/YmgE (transglycosylase-associated protein family)